MRVKILSLAAAVAFLAACAQDPETADESAGSGTAAPTGDVVSVGPAPGSVEEFVAEVGDRVFFAYDRSDLDIDAQQTLDRQAIWLGKHPSVRVTIEGHCDERGTREYNLALGERRANAVRDYLVASGVDEGRIDTISYGKERPVAFGSDEASWAQNRRGVTQVN